MCSCDGKEGGHNSPSLRVAAVAILKKTVKVKRTHTHNHPAHTHKHTAMNWLRK